MNQKTIGIVQARMGSARLPGKVLFPLCGKPMLQWIFERVGQSELLDDLILATSDEKQDDQLEKFSEGLGIPCFRGSEGDVLDRFYEAAKLFNAQNIVRLTGDNPLVDGGFVDWVVRAYHEAHFDYVAAIPGEQWNLPVGLGAEMFSFSALEEAYEGDTKKEWREHVTPFIRNQTGRFKIHYLTAEVDYFPARLTVDTFEDMELLKRIFTYFGDKAFSWREALNLLFQHSDWMSLNMDISQYEVEVDRSDTHGIFKVNKENL